MTYSNSLLIFAKAPIRGFVKTRLIGSAKLNDEETLTLYTSFLKDTLLLADKTASDKIFLSYYPADKKDLMTKIIKDCFHGNVSDKFYPRPQVGGDFDERFTNAVKDVLKISSHVVVIGSDSPHLQPSTIDRAHGLLDKNGSMVLGPSTEGGVYLLGVSTPMDFTGVFTKGVEMDNLVKLPMEKEIPFLLLEELTDIDVETDLISFICRIKAMEEAARSSGYWVPYNTIRTIRDLGLEVQGLAGARGRRLIRT